VIFNEHSDLRDKHAFLSASNYHWLNYDAQKLEARFHTYRSSRRGIDLHALAHEAIRLRILLAEVHESLAAYVNDGIEYEMSCEQPLYYSENCFGTADTISFLENILRIHDLKTGISAVSIKQLEVYAALFCLEYGYSPYDIEIELRLYLRDEIQVVHPEPAWIASIMDKIIDSDLQVQAMKEGRW